jgi:hypothetical protein
MADVLDVSTQSIKSYITSPISSSGQRLGWTGLVRVDGKTFAWMGAPGGIPTATQISAEYTSTTSIFIIHADDKVRVTVTFLSPLTPNDLKRQSLIFSYMNVMVASMDGKFRDIQIYTDISAGTSLSLALISNEANASAEWISGDFRSKAEWSHGTTKDGISYHKVWNQNQQLLGEWNEQAEWGNFVCYHSPHQLLLLT